MKKLFVVTAIVLSSTLPACDCNIHGEAPVSIDVNLRPDAGPCDEGDAGEGDDSGQEDGGAL